MSNSIQKTSFGMSASAKNLVRLQVGSPIHVQNSHNGCLEYNELCYLEAVSPGKTTDTLALLVRPYKTPTKFETINVGVENEMVYDVTAMNQPYKNYHVTKKPDDKNLKLGEVGTLEVLDKYHY